MAKILSRVYISHDVFLACTSHAFATEKEEVMGFLLGDIKVVKGKEEGHVWAICSLMRSDKKADRVEISPELQSFASTKAEELSATLGVKTRIVGWYHSHPHITVHPSHVDVNTQYNYQQMDSTFVGLIFSCFNTNKTTQGGRVQAIAFQAAKKKKQSNSSDVHVTDLEEVNIPLKVTNFLSPVPNLLQELVKIQDIMWQEERDNYASNVTAVKSKGGNALSVMYCSAIYQKAMCRQLEHGCAPLLQLLQQQLDLNKQQLEQLKEAES